MQASRTAGIVGTGSYVPERILTNFDLEKMVDTSDEWIFARTGMRERRIAAPEEATSDLAMKAAERALENAGMDASDLGLILVATVTPDHYVPATACLVQDALGAGNAGAFDVGSSCSGFVNGLITANGMITAGTVDHALVIGAECMSRVVDYEDRVSCILFGDGAGAAVLSADAVRAKVVNTFMGSDGSGADSMRIYAGGSRRPVEAGVLEEKLNFLHIRGNEVFKFAVGKFRELLERQISEAGIASEDIGLVVPHQVNRRIIHSALKKLDVGEDRIFMNLEKYGNTAAASVPIALDEAARAGRIPEGKYLSVLAFGAGLAWASALLEW